MRSLLIRVTVAWGLACLAAIAPARAQAPFPSKPLRLVVPLPAGGPTDFLARTVAQGLAPVLGQPVVVENRPGADGMIAARDVIASPPDGHTLLFAIGSMLAAPLQASPPAFDWPAALAPVGKVARVSFGLIVHPDVPARTVAELVAHARARPDALNYATSTPGELMAAAQFTKATGIRMTRVPYKGGTQAMPDLLAGRIHVMFAPVTLAQAHLKTGAVRVLAVLLPSRSPALPEVPTLAEAGVAGVELPTWQSVFVPARTSPAVVERLAAALGTVLARADVRADIERRALVVETATPQALAATVATDMAAWRSLIAEVGIGAD